MGRPIEFNQTNRRQQLAKIYGLLFGVLLMCATPALQHLGLSKGMLVGVVFGGIAILIGALASIIRDQRFKRGELVIDAETVRLGDDVPIPRKSIRSAYYAPGSGPLRSAVRLLDAKERILAQVAVANEKEADDILDSLKLGASSRVARFRVYAASGTPSRMIGSSAVALGFLVAIAGIFATMPFMSILAFAGVVAGATLFLPGDVDVGADGLLIKGRIGQRFVSWGEVASAETVATGVLVRCKNGETLRLPTTVQSVTPQDKVAQASLHARIESALASYRRGDEPDVAARVARGGRNHEDWMRALFDREGSFRTAPVIDEQLWGIVESPTADKTARAGAAAVLAREAGETDRARLRIAAEACTSPKLRIVLDKSASGATAAEVEEALIDLTDDEAEEAAESNAKLKRAL